MTRLYTVLSVHVSCFVRICSELCGSDGDDDDLLAAGNGPLGVQLVDGLAFGSPVQGQDSVRVFPHFSHLNCPSRYFLSSLFAIALMIFYGGKNREKALAQGVWSVSDVATEVWREWRKEGEVG